jgi:uncharacterized protein (TIGR03437 family)
VRLFLLLAIFVGPIAAADLTFTLNSSSGSGSTVRLAPEPNPPCLAPACVSFSGTLTDTDTDLSFLQLDSISISFDASNPSAGLSLDNTFMAVVPGLLSGDPNFGTSGNPPNVYSGPIFGIDIAPQTAAGTYHATVTIHASGGTGDPEAHGFTVAKAITVTVVAGSSGENAPRPTGGIANAASAGQATPSVVAAGSYIAIYGAGLAGNGGPSATSLPLPTTLNGASVTLCGVPMPLLYASAAQINAIVPQVPAGSGQCPLVVSVNGVASAQVLLAMVSLQPGIYTVNLSGSGPGVVTNALTGQLISDTNPAHAGDVLSVWASGLGPVQGPNGEPGPAEGTAAPLATIFSTKAKTTATVGGIDAPVSFAGLAPTFASLYQVNVQVPAGVTPGSAVPLKISTGGVQSNTVTIVVE